MKMSIDEFHKRKEELEALFDANGHSDETVLKILEDEYGEVSDSDFWILRMILADYQIHCSASRDGNN